MPSHRSGNPSLRLASSVLLIAAALLLAACSANALTTHATHKSAHTGSTPRPTATASHYTTQGTHEGWIYKDELAGYTVTFPNEPDVKPLAINGTDRLANFAYCTDQISNEYIARGEVRDSPPDLRGELFGWLQSVKTSGQIGASSYQLDNLSGARAEFTVGSDQGGPGSLTGAQGETVVASDGQHFYQLIAIGGTSDQRQVFFDSFKLTNG